MCSPTRSEEQPRIWRTAWVSSGIEVNLGGDDLRVSPSNLEISKRCEVNAERLVSEAIQYLAEHLKVSSNIGDSPEVEWVDIGLNRFGEHQELELFLSDASTYVLWAVRFQYAPWSSESEFPFYPVGFSRRRW